MMRQYLPNYLSRVEAPLLLISLSVLLVCMSYVYLLVMQVAFMGAAVVTTPEGWQVISIEPCDDRPEWCETRDKLNVGDILLQIGDLDYATYLSTSSTPFAGFSEGDFVPLLVRRGDAEFEVLWQLPDIRLSDRIIRLLSTILFIPFWLSGTIVLLFLRPRNEGWGLLVAFNYVTALWLAIGFNSTWQIAYSSLLVHVLSWFILPIYIHLHLAVPQSLIGRRTRWFLNALYLLAMLMTILEVSRLVPRQLFYLPFITAVTVSFAILIARSRRQGNESEKPATRLMLFGILMGVGPAVFLAIGVVFTPLIPETYIVHLSLISFPVLPFAYTYALYKRRLGRAEFRANRLLGLYTYSVLLLMLFFLLFAVGLPTVGDISTTAAYVYVIFSVLIFVALTAGLRGQFQRWVNQIAYGVKYDPDQLISIFASQLSGVSQRDKLVEIITSQVLPNLLIRQSVMFFQRAGKADDLIYADGVEEIPDKFDSNKLAIDERRFGEYISEPIPGLLTYDLDWARLVIPLEIRHHRMGVWFFGRRDPDDYYPQQDIVLLQSLASMVAPVLENIQLFDLVQRKLDEQAALLATSRAVSSSLDWPTALTAVGDVLVDTLDVNRVTISEWNSQEAIRSILAVTIKPEFRLLPEMQINLPPTKLHDPEWPLRMPPAGEYTYESINNPETTPDRKAYITRRGAAQLLNFPIYAKAHLVGSVCLWENRPGREFTATEISLTQAIVQQVALAFENAQLFRAEEQRRREAELLAELSGYLASTLDLDEVLTRIVDSVRSYLDDVHNCSISILEHNGLFLRTHSSWSSSPEYDILATKDPIPVNQTKTTRQVLETMQSLCIEDLATEITDHTVSRHLLRNPRALLYVPLIVRGDPIGILHVNYFDQPRHFRPEEVSFCVNVANQAATAIENARLFAAERRQLQLARTLQEMGALLTTRLKLDEVFERIFELLARVVTYDSVSIQLFDKEGNHYLAAGRGFADFSKIRQATQGIFPQSTNTAVREQGLVIGDTTLDHRWHVVPGAEYIRSWVGMPLQVKGVVIGMLNVDSAAPHAYDQTSVETIRTFANQAAVALENARLYRETQERVNELGVLHKVALATAAVLEIDDLIRQTTEMIVGSLNYRPFGFLLVQNNLLIPHPSFHGLPSSTHQRRIRIEIEGEPSTVPYLLAGDEELKQLRTLWSNLKKAVCVPVLVRKQVVSLLCAFSDDAEAFSENDLRFLSTLAGQVSGAIERAQLYDQLQDRAADLAAEVNTRTAQLRTERDRTQAILHNAGEGIFFTSPEGILLYANPAAMRLTGYSIEEVMGLPMLEWLGELISPETRLELQHTVAAGDSWRGEVTGVRKSGVNYAARLTLAPIWDAEGGVTGYVGVQSDITRLREVDRLRAEFIANVSHELRTPLTNIKTYLALLERGKPQSRGRHVDVIKMETERLTRLIEDLLDFSRQQPSQPQLEPVELRDLVNQTVNAFAAKALEKSIVLKADLADPMPCVLGDAHQLGQVLSNLVNNALAYTPAGGKITITSAVTRNNGSEEACIRVSDTGIGIAQNDLPFIFERFYRGAASRQGNIPGTGLGLAISQDIIQRHGGRVHVESEQGRGSTFTVWLPVNGEHHEL